MSFLGPVGSLIPVKCASQLTSSGGREVSFTRTLGKRKAFLGQVRAREWDVEIGLAEPGELSGLRWLAENVNAPMVWYSPDAVVGNILPPAPADLVTGSHSGLEGPLVEVESGVFVKSAFPDGGSAVSVLLRGGQTDPLPIVSERSLTISAWLRGATASAGQVIAANWRNIQGASIGIDSIPVGEPTGGLVRRSLTVTPPVGAVQLTLQFFAEQVAGPAVTLTDRVAPYSPGKGAKRVIAHGLSESLILVTQDTSISSASFTVSEVG